MNNSRIFDVIVVGAGPSGGMLSYYLSQKGLDVLVVEKKKLPRYKPCGGALTRRVISVLPFDISSVIEDYAHTAILNVQNETIFQRTNNNPVLGMVMRDRFDAFLIQKAEDSGTAILDDASFISLSEKNGYSIVQTSKGSHKTRIIVGADGVNSRVSRVLGLLNQFDRMFAIEAAIVPGDHGIMDRYRQSAVFDLGIIPRGYGWVFPKKDHLSVGVLTSAKSRRRLRHYLNTYIKCKDLGRAVSIRSICGHSIPHSPSKTNTYANPKGLLVGDSTGMVDPITGEGIYYAVRGADIAAHSILQYFSNNRPIEEYDTDLKRELLYDLTCARKLAFILYKIPSIAHRVLKAHGNRIGASHLDIITGRKTYGELFSDVFSFEGFRALLSPGS